MKKKILVTGGAGYIGSLLVPELLRAQYHVCVLDNLLYGSFGLDDVRDGIELIEGDVLDPPQGILDEVYGVVHLAGLSTDPTASVSPRETDKINHLGTENIAKLAKDAGVKRFIFASSCSVYFTYTTPLIPPVYKESDALNPISPYSLSKVAAEEALFELRDDTFRPTILRKGSIFGFAPKMRYDLVLNSFTRSAFERRNIVVHANGDIYRPMVDVRDVIHTYVKALELPITDVGGKIFNVSNENWNIEDLAKQFKRILKERCGVDITINIEVVGLTRNYFADNTLYKNVFQKNSSRPMEEAILEMWKNLEAGHDYTDPRFYTDLWHKKVRESKE